MEFERNDYYGDNKRQTVGDLFQQMGQEVGAAYVVSIPTIAINQHVNFIYNFKRHIMINLSTRRLFSIQPIYVRNYCIDICV